MKHYQFATQHDDGSWFVFEFECAGDDDAVIYGLRNRTTNACELFCNDRLLATFDGEIASQPKPFSPASNSNLHLLEMVR